MVELWLKVTIQSCHVHSCKISSKQNYLTNINEYFGSSIGRNYREVLKSSMKIWSGLLSYWPKSLQCHNYWVTVCLTPVPAQSQLMSLDTVTVQLAQIILLIKKYEVWKQLFVNKMSSSYFTYCYVVFSTGGDI